MTIKAHYRFHIQAKLYANRNFHNKNRIKCKLNENIS